MGNMAVVYGVGVLSLVAVGGSKQTFPALLAAIDETIVD